MSKRPPKRRPLVPDEHLWTEVTRSIKPLTPRPRIKPAADAAPDTSASATPRKRGSSPWTGKPAFQPARPATAPFTPAPPPMAEKAMEPRLKRKLMRGQIAIDGTIDLHGMRQSEAHAALRRFIHARYARGDRTLLVITGKGLKKTGATVIEQKGVLRSMLPLWLAEADLAPLISGFQMSSQAHGGEGAYYVRLKRMRG